MSIELIEREFHSSKSRQIHLCPDGIDRFHVFTPFMFDDGDHFVIVLKKESNQWVFSDEAHTFMHLSYDMKEDNLRKGRRQAIIAKVLSMFQVQDRNGELILPVSNSRYGDMLYSFIQALVKISDVAYLSQDRSKPIFMQGLRELLHETVPQDRLDCDWNHPKNDPRKMYTVDYRINRIPRPLFIYALANDAKTRDATIALHQFEKWNIKYQSVAVFDNQELINRRVLARYSDVGDKQFSNFMTNKERIRKYIEKQSCLDGEGLDDSSARAAMSLRDS